MEAIIRERRHYVCIFADETNDPRPTVDYQLGIGVLLVPKEDTESVGILSFHLDLQFPTEVNNVTVSDAIDEVLRSFHVHVDDVCLFVHDSAAYMGKAADRLLAEKGYTNLVHLPCWAHLIAPIPQAVFDSGCLKELKEFNRLAQLLFARSLYWRTKWLQFQQNEMKVWEADHAKLSGDVQARREKQKPAPVCSAQRPTEVRWALLFEAM